VGHTLLTVYSPLNREGEAVYALEVAAKCLHIFNDFFGIPYCLPKLDLIGVSCISVGEYELFP
jgi:puromycin-sensitive aminopeptidase